MKVERKKNAITAPIGFKASGISCGTKKNNALDLALIFSEKKSNAAAIFTKNKTKAWPILLSKSNIRSAAMQAVIINSGNANCSNGENNLAMCKDYCNFLSEDLNISQKDVFPASTGVIGRDFVLPSRKIKKNIPDRKGLRNFLNIIPFFIIGCLS